MPRRKVSAGARSNPDRFEPSFDLAAAEKISQPPMGEVEPIAPLADAAALGAERNKPLPTKGSLMTTEEEIRAIAKRVTDRAMFLGSQAAAMNCSPTERVASLLTAATVMIEAEVGKALAPTTLIMLLAPTFAAWVEPSPGEPIH